MGPVKPRWEAAPEASGRGLILASWAGVLGPKAAREPVSFWQRAEADSEQKPTVPEPGGAPIRIWALGSLGCPRGYVWFTTDINHVLESPRW